MTTPATTTDASRVAGTVRALVRCRHVGRWACNRKATSQTATKAKLPLCAYHAAMWRKAGWPTERIAANNRQNITE
jgi:hypothetical protein